jgi:hypothetical protein
LPTRGGSWQTGASHAHPTLLPGDKPSWTTNLPGQVQVGYEAYVRDLSTYDHKAGDYEQGDGYNRAVVVFPLNALAGHEIATATLVLSADSYDSFDQAPGGKMTYESLSCARYLGALTAEGPPPDTTDWRDIGTGTSPYSVDVTDLLIAWTSGRQPNQGFVLKGEREDLTITGNEACVSYYEKMPQLVVRYY